MQHPGYTVDAVHVFNGLPGASAERWQSSQGGLLCLHQQEAAVPSHIRQRVFGFSVDALFTYRLHSLQQILSRQWSAHSCVQMLVIHAIPGGPKMILTRNQIILLTLGTPKTNIRSQVRGTA